MPKFRYEPKEEDYWEECPECFGTGLHTPRISVGDEYFHGEFVIDDQCEECLGHGKVELDEDEVYRKFQDEYDRQAEDEVIERYYRDKYGDE